jgi:hypothetical protein
MSARLRFWLLAMDVIALCGGFGSRAYSFAVGKAGDATDWGEP